MARRSARGRSRRGLSRRPTLTDCMVMDKKLKTAISRKEQLEMEAFDNTNKALQLHDKAARAKMLAEDSALEIDRLKKKLFHIENQFLRRRFDGPVEVDNLEAYKYVTDQLQLKAVVAHNTSLRARRDILDFVMKEKEEEEEEEEDDEDEEDEDD